MELTYYGHSCFGFESEGQHVLIDPFISPNELAAKISVEDIKADFILLSHGHPDHVADAETIAKNNNATIVANFEVGNWFMGKGIEKVHQMNHGGQAHFPFGTVKYVNAVHTSSMPDGSYGGNPGGFIIATNAHTFYFAGDTALTYDMKLIGEFEKLDFAILPIGDNFTMGIKDAVRAAGFINCKEIVPCHFDTFPPIKIDHKEASKAFSEAGLNLHFIDIGASQTF